MRESQWQVVNQKERKLVVHIAFMQGKDVPILETPEFVD